MPKSIENYIQEIGRAGRRQRRAYCHLFLDKNDYYTERNYFLADQLEPSVYKKLLDELKKKTMKMTTKSNKKKPKDNDEFRKETEGLKRLSIKSD